MKNDDRLKRIVAAMRSNGASEANTPEIGWYYLHINGDLIWKKFQPDPSDFVRKIWPFDPGNRVHAWIVVVEAKALDADPKRIEELITKWDLSNDDAREFANRVGLKVYLDGDSWCATFADFVDLQESQAGFGDRAVDALADLAKGGLTN